MEDTLERAVSLGLKHGGSQVEVFGSKTRTLYLSFEKKQIKRIEQKLDRGIGIRVLLLQGATSAVGSSFTMRTEPEAIAQAARAAISVARTKKPEKITLSFEKETKRRPSPMGLVDRKVKEAKISQVTSLASRMIRTASWDNRIRSVSGDVTLSYYEAFFQNSLGVKGHYDTTTFTTTTWVTAKQSGSIGSAFDGFASRNLNPDGAVKIAGAVAKIALSQLKPRQAKPGKVEVVIGPEALEGLTANTLTFALRADFVQKKQSPLTGRLGQQVAAGSFTLVDDGRVPRYVGSKPFDDEGHVVEKRMVIHKGRLVTYLHNHRTTVEEGKDGAGNALRVSSSDMMRKYAGEPQILPHNLIVKPGKETIDGLVGQVKNGIYARSFIGAHTANRVTGEFSVVPQMAYKITDGEIDYPIKDTVLSGNILELLGNITMIGKDPVHIPSVSGDSSFTSPAILVGGLSISG